MTEQKTLASIMSPEDLERHAFVGLALKHVQSVEDIIRFILTFVIQKGDKLDIFLLNTQTEAERKKTLGYFFTELRKRAGLHDNLDAKLTSFLERRNTLAHRLDDIPGWGKDTPESYAASNLFLYQLISDSFELLTIFAALMRAWQKENMRYADVPNETAIDELTKDYIPMLNDLFFKKE